MLISAKSSSVQGWTDHSQLSETAEHDRSGWSNPHTTGTTNPVTKGLKEHKPEPDRSTIIIVPTWISPHHIICLIVLSLGIKVLATSVYQIPVACFPNKSFSHFNVEINESEQKRNRPNLTFHLKWFPHLLKEDSERCLAGGAPLLTISQWRKIKKNSFSLTLPLMMPSCYLAVPLRDAPASQSLKLVALFQARFALRLWVIAIAVLHFNRRYNLQVPIFPNKKTLISP